MERGFSFDSHLIRTHSWYYSALDWSFSFPGNPNLINEYLRRTNNDKFGPNALHSVMNTDGIMRILYCWDTSIAKSWCRDAAGFRSALSRLCFLRGGIDLENRPIIENSNTTVLLLLNSKEDPNLINKYFRRTNYKFCTTISALHSVVVKNRISKLLIKKWKSGTYDAQTQFYNHEHVQNKSMIHIIVIFCSSWTPKCDRSLSFRQSRMQTTWLHEPCCGYSMSRICPPCCWCRCVNDNKSQYVSWC